MGWWCTRSSQFSKCRPAGHGPTGISVCGVSGAQVGYSSRIDIIVLALTQTLQARSHLSSEPPPHQKMHPFNLFLACICPGYSTRYDIGLGSPISFHGENRNPHRRSSRLSTPPTPTTRISSKVSNISSAKQGGVMFSVLPSSRV